MSDTETFPTLTAVMRALGTTRTVPRRPVPARWHQVALASLTEVEELLDRLERAGVTDTRLSVRGGGFVVRWR
jgi:hypothetical protein